MLKISNTIELLQWKNLRFIYKLLLIYIPLIILPAIFGMLLISNSYSAFGKQLLEKYSLDVLNFGVQKTDDQIKNYEQLSKRFITDAQLLELISVTPETQYDELEIKSELTTRINSYLLENSDYRYVKAIIINKQDKLYIFGTGSSTDYGVKDAAYEKRLSSLKGALIWFLPVGGITGNTKDSSNASERGEFKLARAIYSKSLKELAQVTIVIDNKFIESVFDRLQLKNYTALLLNSKEGSLIFEYNKNYHGTGTAEGKYQKYTAVSSYNGWQLTAVYPEKLLYQPLYDISKRSVLFILIFIILGLIGSLIINIDIIVPIRKLIINIKNTLNGPRDKSAVQFSGAKEIVEINNAHISMVNEMDRLIRELMESEKKKRKAEMKILQSQLTPHFLYNALNSVRWMAIIQKQDNIKSFVDALNNLLTYSLRKTSDMVELRYEIEILNDYVRIQKVRYQNFSFEINIEEDIYGLEILKFLLQPLVENALLHGLLKKNALGIVKLAGKLVDREIHLIVEDNGVGMNREKLEEVRKQIYGIDNDQDLHIGLKNVHERIRLNYGAEYGLYLESGEDAGTRVCLVLPFKQGEEEGLQ